MHATALDVFEASGSAARMGAELARVMDLVPGSFAERERAVLSIANELARRWMERELQRTADGFGVEVRVDGEHYRRHQRGAVIYHSLVGGVEVSRCTYRRIGVHNGATVVPLELVAGLVEGATPGLAFSVAQGHAMMPSRDYAMQMEAAHRDVPSRSTLERLGRLVGKAVQRALPSIEPVVRAAEALPADIASLSLGLDRTTAPMAEPRVDGGRCRRRKPYVRAAPPEPVQVVYRMAYVGTVALHDAAGEAKVIRRFAATAGEGPDALIGRMFDEVEHVLSVRPGLPIAVVQDGAPELWRIVDDAMETRGITPSRRIIDRFHVDEHLAALIASFADDGAQARGLFERWRRALDRSDTAIDRIIRAISEIEFWYQLGDIEGDPRPSAYAALMAARLEGERQTAFSTHAGYLRRNRRHMRYASARRAGLAIGSGVTEGACKSVVTCRFKRSGQRWLERGLSPCLTLRTLHLSERLGACFARVASSYERAVEPI